MNAKKNTKGRASVSVAEYLSQQIHLSGVPQKEIASRMGYPNSNIITMFKQGTTKLPINRVKEMAEILGIDKVYLLKLVMGEYAPETLAALEELIGGENFTTQSERNVLNIMRSMSDGLDIGPKTIYEEEEFKMMVAKWKNKAEEDLKRKVVVDSK